MSLPLSRLDILLLTRYPQLGSRARAQQLIRSGAVRVNGSVYTRPGSPWPHDVAVLIDWSRCPELQYVSRAGYKLAHALDVWGISVVSQVCLDVGISTGGFTDCLLKRGAARVYGVDVGNAQLHDRLRSDSRVVLLEQTDIRDVVALPNMVAPDHSDPSILGVSQDRVLLLQPNLFTVDVSFISSTLVLPAIRQLMAIEHQGIILIKPHFELTPLDIPSSGVVTDTLLHIRAQERVKHAVLQLGYTIRGILESPISGGSGNREWLLWVSL